MVENNNGRTKLAVMATNIEFIKEEIKEVKKELSAVKKIIKEDYVHRKEFEPIKKIVYGMVTIMFLAVIGAIMSGVLK